MNDRNPVTAQENPSVSPLCPHCEAPIHTVWFRVMTGLLGKRYMYFCSNCSKVLGVTQRKGFWMG
jgi:hypothetical protein